ncbi:MFS transporter [Kutzneria sp. CA-103260]|uniref:MFS transporter n=1 Tax=Kutzneria sp. CA-103260 TaxID=2802641 RepID=UPI001BA9612A|nr:MFS transporter [Kutzneria sp. CA-103260]QUQ72141.1 major facilitator superfamily transporter [Kutzneria sp. CA-103260]
MSLLRHRDFVRLWTGDTLSQFGAAIGQFAIPALAVTQLAATPFEVGALSAAETAPFLLVGLPAGVLVDRLRRRPLMLRADLCRFVLLLTIPVAWWLHVLTIGQLIVVALLVGLLTVFFDVAYQSYLPSLVGREHIVEGNAKLQVSQSAAQVSGPALSGLLVQVVGAATAVLATAFGFLASALFLLRIRTVEPAPMRGERRGMRAEIAEGLRFVLHQPTLRAITFCTGTSNLFFSISAAAMLLFLIRQLGLSTGVAGLLMSASGIGAVLGGLTATRLARVFGQARIVWLSQLVAGPFAVLMPLAQPGWSLSLFAVSGLAWGFGAIVYNVAQVSYRQAICPDHLLGRMNASVRFLVWGTLPIGGLLGGALATWLTPRGALWVGAVGGILAVGWLLASPLRTMRDLPTTQAV